MAMRKMRDIEGELKALAERQRALKARHVTQLGKLVIATGADAVDSEILAGALLDVAGAKDTGMREGWRAKGAAFFRREPRAIPDDTTRTETRAGDDLLGLASKPDSNAAGRSDQGA